MSAPTKSSGPAVSGEQPARSTTPALAGVGVSTLPGRVSTTPPQGVRA